jgi:hypothetical protein
MFLPQCETPSFTPIQNNRKNCNFVYFKPTEKEDANRKYRLINAVLWVKHAYIVVVYPISKSR